MVSLEEYASGLIEIATGWLGWKFDEAMHADCCAIVLAYQGRIDMLKACFGSGEEAPRPAPVRPSKRVLTPELFRAMFG